MIKHPSTYMSTCAPAHTITNNSPEGSPNQVGSSFATVLSIRYFSCQGSAEFCQQPGHGLNMFSVQSNPTCPCYLYRWESSGEALHMTREGECFYPFELCFQSCTWKKHMQWNIENPIEHPTGHSDELCWMAFGYIICYNVICLSENLMHLQR